MSAAEAARLLTAAEPEPWLEAEPPHGFTLDRRGVFAEPAKDAANPERIAGPVWVSALTRDPSGGSWGSVVRWIDRDGHLREAAFPQGRLHEDGPALAQDLAAGGLAIAPGREKRLRAYLGLYTPTARLRCVAALGWADTGGDALTYVLPGEVLGAPRAGEGVTFQPERFSPTVGTIRPAGTLADWQRAVAAPCEGNPLLVFAACLGLAGPLLKPGGLEAGGFHLFGRSSHGKTTAAQVAASAWGCGADPAEAPEAALVRRWNVTTNGLEGIAAAHNDGLLVLDEIGTASTHDLGKAVYDLAGGQGKAALDRSRNLRPQRAWRVLFLSTGEVSLRQRIEEETRRTARAGQLLRCLDVPTSGGIIADSHGMSPADFANALKRACGRYFGTAGPAFVGRLVEGGGGFQELRGVVGALLDRETAELTPAGLPAEQARACRRLALVAVAGRMAARFGVLPWPEEVAAGAVGHVRDAWLSEALTLPDAARGVEAVRDFLLRHEARFRPANDDREAVRDLAGFVDGPRDLYLLTPDGLREACNGHDPRTVARELARRGLLFLNEGDRLLSRHTVAGRGRLTLYAVKAALLEVDS